MSTGQPMYEWSLINWRKLERRVFKLQKRIYRASSRGNVKLVRRLQKLLIKSWNARVLAVRRVTQDNQGKNTPGVDGVKSIPPKKRLALAKKITLGTVKPTRRVWIPKPGTEEKRPLGIPTMEDRALQALVKMALEPEWEARFEPNSYGFRPGRSCHDAIEAIFNAIKFQNKFVLDADISHCFDNINHARLLEKLNTYPALRRQIRAWLKAGVMDGTTFSPTPKGTPQGGVISPLLANVALHGMEKLVKELVIDSELKGARGQPMNRLQKAQSIALIRYADDFVIIHKDILIIEQCQLQLEQWLGDMGLELKPSKTHVVHTMCPHQDKQPGFCFLGFQVRQFPVGKYSSGKSTNQSILGFKTIISPSKDSIKRHYRALATVIKQCQGFSQAVLIARLNPMIRGWCNYFSSVVSKIAFSRLGHLLFWKLFKWGLKRHRNKGRWWVASKYFMRRQDKRWSFSDGKFSLFQHSETTVKRHVKVRGSKSPYDGDWIYWSSRMGKHPEIPTKVTRLLKQQSGQCTHCGHYFRDSDTLAFDQIAPKSQNGARGIISKFQLLHRHCYEAKTEFQSQFQTC